MSAATPILTAAEKLHIEADELERRAEGLRHAGLSDARGLCKGWCPVCYFSARARVHRRAAWAAGGMEPST